MGSTPECACCRLEEPNDRVPDQGQREGDRDRDASSEDRVLGERLTVLGARYAADVFECLQGGGGVVLGGGRT